MTTEQIIQRLLDEKHITVTEAVQMIRDLVRNEVFMPMFIDDNRKTSPKQSVVVMYGVNINPSDDWANNSIDNNYNAVSSDKPKEE